MKPLLINPEYTEYVTWKQTCPFVCFTREIFTAVLTGLRTYEAILTDLYKKIEKKNSFFHERKYNT